MINETLDTPIINLTNTTDIPIIDNIYHQEYITGINFKTKLSSQTPFEWFYKQLTHFGIRGLIIGSVVSICLLLFLLFLILHLHCKSRQTKKKLSQKYSQTNGKIKKSYSKIKSSTHKKSHLPKVFRYLHTNQSRPSSSFRLTSNGSISRLNSSDSYHLISSIQENHKDKKTQIHASLTQPISSSIYHQVNRLMISGSEPPLPLPNLTQSHPSTTTTLRSVKRELDNSSAQTYSAVYSCELAANLDIDQEFSSQHRSSVRRRSILKPNNFNHMKLLYIKNLIDCYAIQPNALQTILLATADENRIQLFHIRVSRPRHFQSFVVLFPD